MTVRPQSPLCAEAGRSGSSVCRSPSSFTSSPPCGSNSRGSPMGATVISPTQSRRSVRYRPGLGRWNVTVQIARAHTPSTAPVAASMPLGTSMDSIGPQVLAQVSSRPAGESAAMLPVKPVPNSASTTASYSSSSSSSGTASISAPMACRWRRLICASAVLGVSSRMMRAKPRACRGRCRRQFPCLPAAAGAPSPGRRRRCCPARTGTARSCRGNRSPADPAARQRQRARRFPSSAAGTSPRRRRSARPLASG